MSSQLKKIAEEYSLKYPRIVDEDTRIIKGKKIAAVLKDALAGRKPNYILDVGASGCIPLVEVNELLKPKLSMGIDLDAGILALAGHEVQPMVADALMLPFPDASLDVVICNHVYEHIFDQEKLFQEIFRVLKCEGIVYFGAMNARWPFEPHYDVIFLHWLPRCLSEWIVRLKGYNHGYLEQPLTTKGLNTLVCDFERTDYTISVIVDPARYKATDVVNPGFSSMKIRGYLGRLLYDFLPSYIWILKKVIKDNK